MIPNPEQVKSFIRWVQATIGPILISYGYVSSGTLEMIVGVLISLAPLVWSMFAHTEKNAVAVVDAIAKQPDSPVKAVITEPTPAGQALAASIPGNTTVVSNSTAAISMTKAA